MEGMKIKFLIRLILFVPESIIKHLCYYSYDSTEICLVDFTSRLCCALFFKTFE